MVLAVKSPRLAHRYDHCTATVSVALGGHARRIILAAASAAGAALIASVALGALSVNESGGPRLPYPQNVDASDKGITIHIQDAAFSGTATILAFTADIAGNPAASLRVPRYAYTAASLEPDGPSELAIPVAQSGPALVRFHPAEEGHSPVIEFTAVELIPTPHAPPVTISGHWRAVLQTPADFSSVLRVEHLNVGQGREAAGISVLPLSAVRSASETLLTIAVTSAGGPLDHLGEPLITAGGETYAGGLVSRAEGGKVLTFSFPPTPMGEPIAVRLGPWARVSGDQSSFTDVDFGGIIARNSLQGLPGESASVDKNDVFGNSDDSPIVAVRITTLGRQSGPVNTLAVVLRGNFESTAGDMSAVLPDGTTLRPLASSSSYRKDVARTITEGTTEVEFPFSSLSAWSGRVRLYHGTGNELVRGDWTITAAP